MPIPHAPSRRGTGKRPKRLQFKTFAEASAPACNASEIETIRFNDEVDVVVNADGIRVYDWHDRFAWGFADKSEAMGFAGRRAHVHVMRRQREALRQLEETRLGRPRPESDPLWKGKIVLVNVHHCGWK